MLPLPFPTFAENKWCNQHIGKNNNIKLKWDLFFKWKKKGARESKPKKLLEVGLVIEKKVAKDLPHLHGKMVGKEQSKKEQDKTQENTKSP